MDDLINRQSAINAISCDITITGRQNAELVAATIGKFADRIKALPSAQPEIIRCKDCKHWAKTCGDNQWSLGDCGLFEKHLVMCKGYCAWAERK